MNEVYILNTDIFNSPGIYENALLLIPKERRDKLSSYKFQKDRFLCLAAGLLIRHGFFQSGVSEKDIRLRYNAHKKPYADGFDHIFFNVSHSGKYAVCSFSECETGIDIEIISDKYYNLIKNVCTPLEKEYLLSLPEEKRKKDFFRLWTAKESYMKLLGEGLFLSPKKIEISLDAPLKLICGKKKAYFKEYAISSYALTVCSENNVFPSSVTEISEKDFSSR